MSEDDGGRRRAGRREGRGRDAGPQRRGVMIRVLIVKD